ncbi:hypothetical protein [Anianabacter salinae]|uniref:hypothetical protein n=1 Tax=Anianabacter salinae TaxID=2851023 RepID=UPI00225E12B9|nr:hypothetical protein [Anianabacter salinae]MBV0913053.1 hypothetical protein [Anianabacter salinae]
MTDAVGFWNTGAPLILLVALAWLLPGWLVPRSARSQGRIAVLLGLSALLVGAAGVPVFAAAQRAAGADPVGALAERPVATLVYLGRSSALAVLAWGPIMALRWFGLAQRAERLKGEDMMREGRG